MAMETADVMIAVLTKEVMVGADSCSRGWSEPDEIAWSQLEERILEISKKFYLNPLHMIYIYIYICL